MSVCVCATLNMWKELQMHYSSSNLKELQIQVEPEGTWKEFQMHSSFSNSVLACKGPHQAIVSILIRLEYGLGYINICSNMDQDTRKLVTKRSRSAKGAEVKVSRTLK